MEWEKKTFFHPFLIIRPMHLFELEGEINLERSWVRCRKVENFEPVLERRGGSQGRRGGREQGSIESQGWE